MTYCPKCGCQQEENAVEINGVKQCHTCKAYIKSDGSIAEQPMQILDSRDSKIDSPQNYIIAWAICVGLAFITGITLIPAIIVIVIAFVKFPDNTAVKILFWITIALIVIAVIAVVLLVATCVAACNSCV